MSKRSFLFFIATLVSISFLAQETDPVVLKINGKSIRKSEFTDAYKEGNQLDINTDANSLNKFVQSYIDFRLNVEEARNQRLDTTAAYKREYNSYKMQMSSAYLKDTIGEAAFVKKIYDRMKENIEVNHVLLPFDKSIVFPSDTLALYNKALELRTKLLEKGFTAGGFTDNPGTGVTMDIESKNGYIGWIEPFMFSPTVEDVIVNLSVNEISMPIRTIKGYHIVQVLGRRPAIGAVNIEQVMFNFPNIPATQHQIDSVGKLVWKEYANIKKPADFQSLCDEFAQVHGAKDCSFGVVGLSSLLPLSFISAAMNLQNVGDVSKPVMTDYGFHILRLVDKIPVPDFSVIKKGLTQKIFNSDNIHKLNAEKRERLSEMFLLFFNSDAYAKLNDLANTVSPLDSTFISQVSNGGDTLFTIDGRKTYYVKDFMVYVQSKVGLMQPDPNDLSVVQLVETSKSNLSTDNLKDLFSQFQYRKLLSYAEETLEERFPDFQKEMNAFSDGILLFTVKKENIWGKAQTDEQGLAKCFNRNKQKYTLGGTKYKGLIIYAKNENALKKAESMAQKTKNREALMQAIVKTFNADSVVVQVESGIWELGDNSFIDNKIFGGSEPDVQKGYPYFFVTGRFIDKPEDFRDVRNAVESDYQEILEKEWATYLRKKYAVEVDESVLNTIE